MLVFPYSIVKEQNIVVRPVVEITGIEPVTSALQRQRSPN